MNIKRLFLYAIACGVFAFGGINSAMAATHTVTYDCNTTDGGSGTAPDSQTVSDGEEFTPATNTCTPPNGKHFSGWLINGTSDILPAGVPMTYNYGNGINLIAQYTTGKFSIITTNLSQGATGLTLKFYISASGNFTVDCGSDGTLAGTGVSGTTITRTTTTEDEYTCTYTTGGIKTITFDGNATGYNVNSGYPYSAAISFWNYQGTSTSELITAINGSLGTIFQTLNQSNSGQPRFSETFRNTRIMSIPNNLFAGVSGAANIMFNGTFYDCINLKSIPSGLFSGVSGAADDMFGSTFAGCTSLKSIPSGLFSGVSGAAPVMFADTFTMCTSLKTIPSDLFSGVSGAAPVMFAETFAYCTSLESIPSGLFSSISGVAEMMFEKTFAGCTSLKSIPSGLFSGVSGAAPTMFAKTFTMCTSLKTIPSDLFSGVSGAATWMFSETFSNCTSLESIPSGLFSGVSGAAQGEFYSTFSGCTGLTGYIPSTMFAGLVANDSPYADYMMSDIFSNTGLDTSCPSGTIQNTTGYESYWNQKVSCIPIIQLNWFNDNTQLTVPTASQSCEYGGGITLPTAPTRSGYTFGGWRVRTVVTQCVLSEHYPANDGIDFGYINDRTHTSNPETYHADQYELTENNTWATEFTEGTLKGRALCSGLQGNNHNYNWGGDSSHWTSTESTLLSSSGEKKYCWCAGTDFGNSCHVASPSWVFIGDDYGNSDYCAQRCAIDCSQYLRDYPIFRQPVFGITE